MTMIKAFRLLTIFTRFARTVIDIIANVLQVIMSYENNCIQTAMTNVI